MPRKKQTPEEAARLTRLKEDERRELAAMMLVDSVFETDAKAAERYGKSADTVGRYRQLLATDPVLRGMVDSRIAERRAAWAEKLPESLAAGLDTIRAMFTNIRTDPVFKSNPGAIKEVSEAVYRVAEIELTLRTLHVGTPRQNSEERDEADRTDGADGAGADRSN